MKTETTYHCLSCDAICKKQQGNWHCPSCGLVPQVRVDCCSCINECYSPGLHKGAIISGNGLEKSINTSVFEYLTNSPYNPENPQKHSITLEYLGREVQIPLPKEAKIKVRGNLAHLLADIDVAIKRCQTSGHPIRPGFPWCDCGDRKA